VEGVIWGVRRVCLSAFLYPEALLSFKKGVKTVRLRATVLHEQARTGESPEIGKLQTQTLDGDARSLDRKLE
jgi:hypothetical protein